MTPSIGLTEIGVSLSRRDWVKMAQQQPAQQTRDPTRAIVASLFTAPPGSAAPRKSPRRVERGRR